MEVRRTLVSPGETTVVIGPASGTRRARIECFPPPQGRVSAMVIWTPAERLLTARLQRPGAAEPVSRASGQSPIVLGAAVDTADGPCNLILDDLQGGTDTILISLQVNWTGSSAVRPRMSIPTETIPSRPTNELKATPTPASLTCRISEISWREGGEIERVKLMREGLRMRFGGAVNKEMLAGAIRCAVGLPGSQDGLLRFEDVHIEIRVEENEVTLQFPPKLLLGKRTLLRVTLIGERLLSRDGTFVDAEGSGFKLPSGNGMPGGVFQSELTITQ